MCMLIFQQTALKMLTLLLFLLFVGQTAANRSELACKKCQATYNRCLKLNLDINQQCELARRLCFQGLNCEYYNIASR